MAGMEVRIPCRTVAVPGNRIKIVCNSQLLEPQWMLHQEKPAGWGKTMLIANLLHSDADALATGGNGW